VKFVFYKKPTVLKKSKISEENSGKETCSLRTVAATFEESLKGIT